MDLTLRADLIFSELGDELVVYDPRSHQAHNLQKDAAALFRQLHRGETPQWDDRSLAILGQLDDAGLLEQPFSTSRREIITGAAKVAGVAFLASVTLATPAAAQSGVTEAVCDASTGEFCGQLCTDGGPIGSRVCASITGFASGPCGCVPAPGVCACT